MANKIKKLFVIGSTVSALFMALAACNGNDAARSSNNPSQANSSENSSSENPSQSSNNEQSSSSFAPAVTLVSIAATANKNEYERNEQLDIVVIANYSDGSTATINDYQIEGYDATSIGEQTITVSYKGQTSTLNILVKQPVVTGIVVDSLKENYEWGEELELVVTATYSDGSSAEINEGYTVEGYNGQIAGNQEVRVVFEGQSSMLQVKVNDPILLSLNIQGQKDTYEYDEELSLVVTASYSDGSTVNVTDYTVSGFDSKNPGEQTVTVSYADKTVSFNTKVNKAALTSISVAGNKDTYEWSEELDLVVTASYADGSSKDITDYTVSGFNAKKPGEQTVTVTYEGKSTSFKVTVNNPALTGITAVSNKDSYNYGERLKLTVIATYADGSQVEIKDYQVSGYNSKNAGIQRITVTFEDKTCSLFVVVNECILTFPIDELNSFLLLEGIDTEVPAPAGYLEWSNNTGKEQDGSNFFFASTEDEGIVGSDSLADQYAVVLENDGWTVNNKNNKFSATKDGGDAELVFSTINGVFSLRVYSYVEFPETKTIAKPASGKVALGDECTVILGSTTQEYIVNGFENGSFKTTACYCDDTTINNIPRDAWRFTIKKASSTKYSLLDANGRKLGATGLNKLAWDQGSTEWSLTISSKSAILTNVNKDYGRLAYNANSGLLTTSKSDNENNIYPQLFKLSSVDIVYATGMSLEGKTEVGTERTTKLAVKYIPEDANSVADIRWSSSNEEIATVNDKGVITGVSVGSATITAKAKSKGLTIQTSYDIEVKETVPDAWTIMIYMCGADLESRSGLATSDIREILSVDNQPDDVNIIIETGGSRSWSYPGIDASKLCRFHVENKKLVLDEKVDRANMGKQSTFEDFLNWGLENYPASKTGVVMWNHGGALGGCCCDENYGGDAILNSEAGAAFDNVFTERGMTDKLEFIGYDCCLMQVQDIAEFNSHYFNYMVGSEEVEDGYGWDYDNWVDDLYAYKSTEDILKATCDSFITSVGQSSDQTLSYLKLSNMATFYSKLETMSSAIYSTVKANKSAFNSVITSSKRFYSFSSYGVMDGLSFLNKLKASATFSAYNTQIEDAIEAYGNLVAYSRKGSSAGDANGLAFIASTSTYFSYELSETNFVNWRSLIK